MDNKYTDEVNVQILISLLKKHNIKRIIANPGTTNINFVASAQMDDFFEIYSCVDERSAAYIACGMADESGEPVVLTCTGATASRNYVPALTEAFYRNLPVIAITATQHLGRIGQNVAQVLDRSTQFKDIVKKSVQIPSVYSEEDKWACNLNINDALLECKRNGGGPVHINLVTTYSNNFNITKLPDERKIERICNSDSFPVLNKKVAIFVGNHKKWTEDLTNIVDEFCEKYNGVVLCDHTSNYHGKYRILGNLVCSQNAFQNLKNIEILIHIGDISGAYMQINPKEVWRVNPDGEIRDTFKKLKYVFEMEEIEFFKKYNLAVDSDEKTNEYYNSWLEVRNELYEKMIKTELPFSNLWIAKNTIELIKDNSIVHLAILNTLRSWNYFETSKNLNCYSNTGGFGIDGIVSTAIGASLSTNELVYCFVGDLAFFYDLNSIGNREIKNNLRIMLINNGGGTEFHNYNHRATKVSNENNITSSYFAADGHYGNKSKNLVKHYAEDLGFEYMSANTKEEFLNNIKKFTNEKSEKSMIFEIFTNSKDESNALEILNTIEKNELNTAKDKVKNILGQKNIDKIKKIMGK